MKVTPPGGIPGTAPKTEPPRPLMQAWRETDERFTYKNFRPHEAPRFLMKSSRNFLENAAMKKQTMCAIWRAALDRVRSAESVAANTRQRWTALTAALDRRAHAHNALELAIDE